MNSTNSKVFSSASHVCTTKLYLSARSTFGSKSRVTREVLPSLQEIILRTCQWTSDFEPTRIERSPQAGYQSQCLVMYFVPRMSIFMLELARPMHSTSSCGRPALGKNESHGQSLEQNQITSSAMFNDVIVECMSERSAYG